MPKADERLEAKREAFSEGSEGNTSGNSSGNTSGNTSSEKDLSFTTKGVDLENSIRNDSSLSIEQNSPTTWNDQESSNIPQETQRLFLLIKTQYGCKVYQKKIKLNPRFANDFLYPVLKPKMLSLINDEFGAYLYKDFCDVLNPTNFQSFVSFVASHFYSIVSSPNGTKVVQKMLEKANIEDKIGTYVYQILGEKIEHNVVKLAIDENSTYIVQKFMIQIKAPYNDFIFEEIINNLSFVSSVKYGCCVVERCLVYGTVNQKKKIIINLLENVSTLIYHPFGNYFFQCLILLDDSIYAKYVFDSIKNYFFDCCKGKYSSCVIEKFFEIKDKFLLDTIVSFFLETPQNILTLICNEFGNFVIKKLLNSAINEYLEKSVLTIISQNINIIQSYIYGKKFLYKLNEKYPILRI